MTSKFLMGVLAVLATAGVFGCGETPIDPIFGGTPGGGTQAGFAVTLSGPTTTVSTTSAAVIVATATQNGAAAANGTVVQFTTTAGLFTNGNQNTTTGTTTGGVVIASLSSQAAGIATVTARVNNVADTLAVTFVAPNP